MLADTFEAATQTPAPALTTTPPPVHAIPPDAPTILLVEDSATQRRLVERILAGFAAWHIVHAPDGVVALEQIERSAPSVVLTDLYMPRMDGLVLVGQIRQRFPHIPVVLMTGRGSEQIAVDALKAGASEYVPKRALVESVGPILERVLDKGQAETDKLRLLSEMTGRVTRFSLENDARLVSPLVAQIRAELLAMGLCDKTGAMRAGIALEEALLNAIYHGNLEVSSDLREKGDEPFYQMVAERRTQEPYRNRRVRFSARVSPKRATFVVRDEGPGFDVAKIPDPTDPEYLDRPSGRGLLLMRAFMDEVRYNAVGNQVTMVKLRDAV